MFNEDNIEFEEVDDDLTAILAADRTAANYQKTGDVITLPYTETSIIEQPFATKSENLQPFMIFNWIGDVDLDPPVDEWKETTRAPDIVVNVNGTFDNLLRERGLTNSGSCGKINGQVILDQAQTNKEEILYDQLVEMLYKQEVVLDQK